MGPGKKIMENTKEPSLREIIKFLLAEIEKKDIFMKNHAERVAATCLRFSKHLGLGQTEINQLYVAGLLHDIGYLYLPLNIVIKRCQPDDEELDIVKRHPLISEKIASKYATLQETLPFIRQHHESIDGSGYPDGLKGDQILLGSKILSIVDRFDGLTVTRPQFKTVNSDAALTRLKEESDKRFDKELIEKFIKFVNSPEFSCSAPSARSDPPNKSCQNETPQDVKPQVATHISREVIQQIINKYKKDEIELPVLSRVVQEIQNVMNNPSTTVDQLASIIERDAVISVRMIAVANSPIYRGAGRVVTVKDAIPRMGVKETHSIVTTISNKSIYDTKDKKFKSIMENLWLHSLASGYIAKALSNELKLGEIELYYFLGLVHDIGKVLLLKSFSDLYAQNESLDTGEIMAAIHEAHNSFGGAILRKWGYSEAMVRIPLLHEGPDFRRDMDKEILIINLASNIADNIGYGLEKDRCSDPSKCSSAKLLEVDIGMIEDIGGKVKLIMNDVSNAF
jgi:HD-GYP domain-containing protein (c-di-GMP phosphodiesterase class II)